MTDREYLAEAREWLEHIKNLTGWTAADSEKFLRRMKTLEWLIQQAEKAEWYEKVIKECIERMDEGGAGTRSFVYEKLSEALEGAE